MYFNGRVFASALLATISGGLECVTDPNKPKNLFCSRSVEKFPGGISYGFKAQREDLHLTFPRVDGHA